MSNENNEDVYEPSILKARSKVEGIKVDKEQIKKLSQQRIDMLRMFQKVFNTKEGKVILEEIEKLAKYGYPDYENEKKHYAKTGQLELVNHIKNMLTVKVK